MTTILIADDESSIRTILKKAMERKNFTVLTASSGDEALRILQTEPIDAAIVDIRMPEISGLELLDYQKTFPSKPAIFVVTAQDTMENAVEAMKRGAYDYLTKPFDLAELGLLMDRALEAKQLEQEVVQLRDEMKRRPKDLPTLVGKSKPMREIFKTIGLVANQDVTVLIQGESGTGKELVARAIHYQGKRAPHPFLALNCSAIPAELLESELFGHSKGAFTGAVTDKVGYVEQAHLGTLFLDEIGDMPLPLQAKLLRVLQEKKIQRLGETRLIAVDVRFIAATNQNLTQKVAKGTFREDLFFRLNVVPMALPSLASRSSDIPLLVQHFAEKTARELGAPIKKISAKAMEYLENRKWPGNARELENLVKRVVVLTQTQVLEAADFKRLEGETPLGKASMGSLEEIITRAMEVFAAEASDKSQNLHEKVLKLFEKPLIEGILKKTHGNQIQAAKVLGINRNTLRKKIRELEIDV